MNLKLKIIFVVLGLFIFILLFRWNSFTAPFERDEGEYAYSARLLLNGGLPYKESFLQKPPLIIYTYALGQLVSPEAVWPPRFLAALFIFATALLVGFISAKEYGRTAGLAASFILVPMLFSPYLAALAANTEVFMLLPLMAVLALYVWSKGRPDSLWINFAAGFLSVTAILYKPIALFPLIFLFSVWLWDNRRKSLQFLFSCAMGAIFAVLLWLGYFFIRDGGKSFWECVVVYNRFYFLWLNRSFYGLIREFSIFLKNWWFLFFFLFWFLFARPNKWWFYFGLFVVSLIGTAKTAIGHYYLLLMPFWAIIAAGSIASLSSVINQKVVRWPKHKIIFWISAFVVAMMVNCVAVQFFKLPKEITVWVYGYGNPFIESVAAAQKLKEITAPQDYVFISGSEPQILYYADRKSSSRFVIIFPFVIDSPFQLRYQQEAIEELKKNPPKAIIVSPMPLSGLWSADSPQDFKIFLDNLINEKYYLVSQYFPNENFSEPSLLLYKQK